MIEIEKIPRVIIGGRSGFKMEHADLYVGHCLYRNKVKAINTVGNVYYLQKDLDEYLKTTATQLQRS